MEILPMQTSIGAYQAKTHFSALLESVENGDYFIITKHGMPIAKLIPFSEKGNFSRKETILKLKNFNKGNKLNLDWKKLRDEGRR